MNNLILATEDQKVLTITLNRIDKKNALNTLMYQLLCQQLAAASINSNIHCVIIQGNTEFFCAGNDLKEFVEEFETSDLAALELINILVNFKKPIIAAVAGPAIGIGTTLLLHCDIVIAANNSLFKLPFSQLGLCPEAGSSLLLPQLVGHKKAFELLVLGNSFTAEEALNFRLVNQVCNPNELLSLSHDIAIRISTLPFDSVLASKALLQENNALCLAQVIKSEVSQFKQLLKSEDCQSILAKLIKP